MFYVFIFDFALIGLLLCAVALLIWFWSYIPFGEDRKPQPMYLQSNSARSKAHIKERTKRYA
jgi:hypothetical protein